MSPTYLTLLFLAIGIVVTVVTGSPLCLICFLVSFIVSMTARGLWPFFFEEFRDEMRKLFRSSP